MKNIAHYWMQQGREEEKAIMAKKMMKEGFSLESVIKITKLSKEDLEK
ncbi:MAG TPA: hypothetical protein LFV90_04340 [Rickettsia endosymbiont of Columbicola hoogstraali]|nr:hypothetical protein [Rickettsia endosymbiont of Columbicola hoogstraali]